MNDKILSFPKSKIVREIPPNIQELEKAKEKGLMKFADGIVDEVAEGLIIEIENYGIDTETQSFARDMAFTIDSLRAAVYRTLALDHNLHKFIDEAVIFKPRSEILEEMAQEKLDAETETEEDENIT
jgi:hypothetical protein